jgi:cysteine desulfurase
VAYRRREVGDGNHLVSSVIEHKAVIEPLHRLEEEGFEVTWVDVDRFGMVDPGDVAAALTDRTILVSVMLVNNEIATVQPLREISAAAHEVGAWVHSDAAQGVGKIPVNVDDLGVDLLSLTAHKFYGPKGIGALYVRKDPRSVRIRPAVVGGGQERGIRSGTHNVPGIVGLGVACELAEREREDEMARLEVLRDRLEAGLRRGIEDLIVNGDSDRRLTNSLSVSIPRVDGEAILLALEDIAVSSGSACDSSANAPSHVMTAIGHSEELARSTVRFGLGRWTTEEEIDFTIDRMSETIARLKSMTALP